MNRNILTFLLLLAASLPASAGSKMTPMELFCESLKNPVGIDARHPEFGWTPGYAVIETGSGNYSFSSSR